MGGALRDERTGAWHNYQRKPGVLGVRFHAPKWAPAWATDPTLLWSRVEQAEVRSNAAVARELIVALPAELDPEQRDVLACAIAEWLVARYGIAVMTVLHAPNGKGDKRNFHAHLLMTTRRVAHHGFEQKVRVLDDRRTGKLEVRAIREVVAEKTNVALWRAGVPVRVDHRTLKAQALDAERRGDFEAAARLTREPTRHEPREVVAQVRQGRLLDHAQRNQSVRTDNQAQLARTLARLSHRKSARHPTAAIPRREALSRIEQARGQDAALLNAQARAMRQSVQADAEFAEAYDRMFVAADMPVQPLAPTVQSDASPKRRRSASVAHPSHRARSNPIRPTHARSSGAPRTAREWAEFRRLQRRRGIEPKRVDVARGSAPSRRPRPPRLR